MGKKETRTQKIERYMKLSKKDLAIMLVNTQFTFDVMVSKEPLKMWNSYLKKNS